MQSTPHPKASPSSNPEADFGCQVSWVAVKELNLSYYIGETLLFTIHTHYGNLI